MSEQMDRPQLLKIDEVAALLTCGRTTVYALVKSGKLESVKMGGLRRFTHAGVRRYLATLTGHDV